MAIGHSTKVVMSRFAKTVQDRQKLHDVKKYNTLTEAALEVIEDLTILEVRPPIKFYKSPNFCQNTVSRVSESVFSITHRSKTTQTFILETTDKAEVSHTRVELFQVICLALIRRAMEFGAEPAKISDWEKRIYNTNVHLINYILF